MRRHEVWFVIPSANARNCARTLPAWREMGYRVAVLQDRVRFRCDADVVEEVERYPGWAATVNHLVRGVVPREATAVVSGGDDMLPDPNHRAVDLAEQFLERFPDGFGVMQPHGDSMAGTDQFCGSPWFGRGWMDRMYLGAGPMCAAYMHNWADTEVYWVARCLDALWVRRDLVQRHDHFTLKGEEKPDYWVESVEGSDATDTRVFIERARRGFPGHEPIGGGRRFDTTLFEREYSRRAERHWEALHAGGGERDGSTDASRLMEEALRSCAERGIRRVALYGAGRHTAKVGPALMSPPVEVACIIDDDPARMGTRLWGIPVASRSQAEAMGIEGVVLSSDGAEDRLAEACEGMRGRGVEVVRLYGGRASRAAEEAPTHAA